MDIGLDSEQRLARDTETAIYRIVQEALSNAVKHAQAEHVGLQVELRSDQVQLVVQDDGRGFEPGGVHAGFGLTGMRSVRCSPAAACR